MQCSKYVDLMKVLSDDEREKYRLLLEILTPVAKSYPAEMGILSISQGLQCLGGSGYCDDYPLEQYFRDARIHPIHEGTTGIQAMDLLGRKVIMQNGQAFMHYVAELHAAIEAAKKYRELENQARQLGQALNDLEEVTKHLLEVAQNKGPELFLADATLYLEMFGNITIAWQWLQQGIAVQTALQNGAKKTDLNFYQGKMFALNYFFGYELPKTMSLFHRLMNTDALTVEMETAHFSD
jgi:butyryl-CoA dehydrogenase